MQLTNYVLDVNIWISLFLKDDYVKLIDWILVNRVLIFRSDVMTDEILDVLHRDRIIKLLKLPISYYFDFYKKSTFLFNPVPFFTGCSDPDDNYLFDLSEQSGADYLVTGDKKVLATKTNFPIKIITLSEFKQIIYEHF